MNPETSKADVLYFGSHELTDSVNAAARASRP